LDSCRGLSLADDLRRLPLTAALHARYCHRHESLGVSV
jgi:hypothetical protein